MIRRFWYIILLALIITTIITGLLKKRTESKELSELYCSTVCPYSSRIVNDSIRFDSSHIIRHYSHFVCPQNFRNLADWVYEWPDQFQERVEKTTNKGKVIAPCLPPGSIIYARVWAMEGFFALIYPHLKHDFVLITGEGDHSSPTNISYLEGPDSKIIHWFGQNGQYDKIRSHKFTHIPIGINCYEMAEAIQGVYLQQSKYKLSSSPRDEDEPLHYIQPLDVTHRVLNQTLASQNLVLINFDKGTDRTGLRSNLWENLCTSKNNASSPSFTTCLTKPYGVQIGNMAKIYERNRQYPFWLSPRGNGIDCHRTWEALYLDIIPIVWNGSLNVLYENLPVVIINDYRELNETFLRKKLHDISEKKLAKERFYQYEKLRHAYWRRLILEKSRHKGDQSIYERQKQCWRAHSTVKWKSFPLF